MRSRYFWTVSSRIAWPTLALCVSIYIGACSRSGHSPSTAPEPKDTTEATPQLAHPVTVSGVSSGGYMAVQIHVALADRVAGAGVVAGGPYHCAAGSVRAALGGCISGDDIDVAALVAFARKASAGRAIASARNLQHARVWIFHSVKDAIIGRGVALALVDYYRHFVPDENIKFVDDVDAAHGWPTVDAGIDCLELGGDFINACGYDTAGELLNQLYGDLSTPTNPVTNERPTRIDLSGYFQSGSGIASIAYIYVPQACRGARSDCRLHISFHGCRQGSEFIGDRFAANSGLNEWAEQNRIVVLYPQIESSASNPQGCWDWWGYTGPQYDLKSGKQIAGIDAIISAFARSKLYRSSRD